MIGFAVLALPIEYVFFPNLIRQEIIESEEGVRQLRWLDLLDWIVVILELIILSGISIWISVVSLFIAEREIWYYYLIPMAWTIFLQIDFACVNLQRRLLPFVLPILVIAFIGCIILPIRDLALPYEPEILTTDRQVSEELVLSETEIKARLNAVSISVPSYNSGAYIYEINKEEESGYGLALVTSEYMEFLSCEYKNQTSGIVREHYPKEEIVQIGIQLQTENEKTIPYAKFGVLKRPHIFSKPEIDFYVLLNMQSGEITEQSN